MFSKRLSIILKIFFLILTAVFVYLSFFSQEQNPSGTHVLINNRIIPVEIADDRGEQVQGLSDRESLAKGSGMLFVFPQKEPRSFWMKNMHFPLDILWISDNRVINISQNLAPEGENPENSYSSEYPVNYVLEVNAGLVDEYGIEAGDRVEIEY